MPHYVWWDKGSCHHRSAVQSLSACQWTVLQDKCTIPTSCKPVIMCYSPICQNNQVIKEQCSLVISHMPCTYVPIAVTSYLWIIPSNLQTQGSTMTIIYPDKTTSTVLLLPPFHISRLSPACSATSNYFHLLPHYEDHFMVMNVSLDTTNINAINISTLDFRMWQYFNRNWTKPLL